VTDEVFRLDAYVEGVLAGRRGGPRPLLDPLDVDPAANRAADLLARTLVRFHPSFRFEDALAARLQAVGEAMHDARPEPLIGGSMVVFPRGIEGVPAGRADEPTGPHGRGLLVGGAIASGLSLAGAAYLAWRRGHRVAS